MFNQEYTAKAKPALPQSVKINDEITQKIAAESIKRNVSDLGYEKHPFELQQESALNINSTTTTTTNTGISLPLLPPLLPPVSLAPMMQPQFSSPQEYHSHHPSVQSLIEPLPPVAQLPPFARTHQQRVERMQEAAQSFRGRLPFPDLLLLSFVS
jgi:hypothetical protein